MIFLRAQFTHNVKPISFRQHHIQHDHIVDPAECVIEAGLSVVHDISRVFIFLHNLAKRFSQADFIFRDEIAKAHLEGTMNQYFAVLTNMRSVGVMGDGRTYDYTLALRSVTTTDFMTADWTRIPYDVLDRVSVRIVNEVPNINRIVYDITSKPPATIEWE